MQDAQEDINREMKQAEEEGVDEHEITSRVNRLLVTRNARVRQMDNLGGATSTVAKEKYSKCADMSELRSQYQVEAPPSVPVYARGSRTRAEVRRAYAEGRPEVMADTIGGASFRPEGADAPPAVGATAETSYGLKEDEAVSMAQTERIVQRIRHKK
jgi:hypothetical protein